ncbi:MAG: Glycerol kinase [uncultured Acidimicrobiales bacterium]|uniref:Glycerol kinase n=1 Tax=uncultured Acidimicrobiales bacterium TaxID=310071 RepID=A0A6J4JDY5_9ACTN|nr:MAG: Glycerol kinase [uncultured Acidimicrobiales bacterium]
MSLLVIDVGTSSVRASIVTADASVTHTHRRTVLPSTPSPGFVELDASALAEAVLEVSRAALAEAGPVDAVGITNQRATTIVWDRQTGEPVGPGIGWQDQRTVMMCLAYQAQGLRFSPSSSATKLAFLLDTADPDRTRDLCFGTVDTWVAWTLSAGALHVTDLSNAGVTGLMRLDGSGWDTSVVDALRIPTSVLPRIVDSSGIVGPATALPGTPPIAGMAGDQQASLIGQGCTRPGMAKMTFGTGGMLDLCLGPVRPECEQRGSQGTFPIVAWRRGGRITWGIEAFMLTAGQAVEWLRDDLGVIRDAAESEAVASACDTTGDVWFVPALLGLATPAWDFGARGTLLGLTGGTGRAEVVRAVLEGVAHRGADLLEAAEADGACEIPTLRVDGGMSANGLFVQALADACQRPVEVSPVLEATTLGAAFLAGMAVGIWADEDDVAAAWSPRATVEPVDETDRDRWREACRRARGWIPELSALDF